MTLRKFQLPYMTTSQREAITPSDKDLIYDTDLQSIFVGDGSTSGGVAISGAPTSALEAICICVSDEITPLVIGTAKVTFRMPFAMTLGAGTAGARASVNTAPTGAGIIVDINEGGSSIFSTRLTIDANELTSLDATAVAISDTSLADDAVMTIDIDQVGSTIAGKGLKVYLIGTRT